MARFTLARPSRFFRRQSSAKSAATNDASSTTTNTDASDTRATTPITQHKTSLSSSSLPLHAPTPRKSPSLTRLRGKLADQERAEPPIPEARESAVLELQDDLPSTLPPLRTPSTPRRSGSETLAPEGPTNFDLVDSKSAASASAEEIDLAKEQPPGPPPPPLLVTLEEPTPGLPDSGKEQDKGPRPLSGVDTLAPSISPERRDSEQSAGVTSSRSVSPGTVTQPRTANPCRQSLVHSDNARIVNTLVEAPAKRNLDDRPHSASTALPTSAAVDCFTPGLPNMASLLHRKIWVRRPGASATLVQIREDDLVDDVRDMILKKYANSLGRTFDAPDMTLRIAQRTEHTGPRSERVLGPEEEMSRTIDSYYPGGQQVDEALIIDVPQRRTPRPSPGRGYQQTGYNTMDEYRPLESGNDYFPQMPAIVPPTVPQTSGSHDSRGSQQHPSLTAGPEHHRSISVLNTGQIPPLPSPGGTRRHRELRGEHRPRIGRQHTSSPTLISHPSNTGAVAINPPQNLAPIHLVHRPSGRSRLDSSASENPMHTNGAPAPPPLPTPPAPEAAPTNKNNSTPPTPSDLTSSHLHRPSRPKKPRKVTPDKSSSRTRHQRNGSEAPASNPTPASGMLDGSVPPINVLIVEDNIINLRILEGLMKRLKVRWQTAMNGQIAVDTWRKGGFHLVLMDIQMPIMNGLAATKEIRRLERVNGIGVFSSSSPTSPVDRKTNGAGASFVNGVGANAEAKVKDPELDRLSTSEGLFKSPVIIVALTASSLQSDRHEALAAGCNDFLTKPVNFVWLERKVKEWGCMQALIDFDGWRKWKDYAAREEAGKTEEQRQAEMEKEEKQRVKMEKLAKLQEKQRLKREEDERNKKKRLSVETGNAVGKVSEEGSSSGTNGAAATDES